MSDPVEPTIVPLLCEDDRPLEVLLNEAWGTRPLRIDGSWLDTGGLDLSIDALGDIIRTLPDSSVSARIVGQDPAAPYEKTSLDERPLSQQLRERPLHISVLDMQDQLPTFRRLLDSFVDKLAPVLERTRRSDLDASIGLFIGAGGSVVPYHVDFEHNFLIQLTGSKTMYIFPDDDQELFPEPAREQLAIDMGPSRFLPYHDHFADRAHRLDIEEGVATYQPPLWPHFVENHPGMSASLLISISTSREVDLRLAHRVNAKLRSLGLAPPPVSGAPVRSRVKSLVGYAARAVSRALKPVRTIRGRQVNTRTGAVIAPPLKQRASR